MLTEIKARGKLKRTPINFCWQHQQNSKWQQREFPQEEVILERSENNPNNIVAMSYHYHINNFERNKKLICTAEKKSITANKQGSPIPQVLQKHNWRGYSKL